MPNNPNPWFLLPSSSTSIMLDSEKRFTISCSRMTSAISSLLVVALLFSSLLTACARHVAALKANDGLEIGGGHVDVVSGVDAGKAGVDDVHAASSGGGSSRAPRTVEMRAATEHRRDAAAEMHDMLRRDYAWKARRRSPIHNDEPLQEEDEP